MTEEKNETGCSCEAARLTPIDTASLLERYRKVKSIDLPACQKRVRFMLENFVSSGDRKHLVALDALLSAVVHQFVPGTTPSNS